MTTRTRHGWVTAPIAVALIIATSCANDRVNRSTVVPTVVPASTTSTSVPPAATPATGDAVAPDAAGPFGVGRQVIEVTDPVRGRTLTVDVWYPAEPDATGSPSRYSFLPTVFFDSELALDAPPVASGGPFPLVVYSHGSGGLRYVSTFFTEVLASRGYVVVAPDHAGNTAVDEIAGTEVSREQNAVNRVGDVAFVVTHLLERSASDGDPFAGAVDADRVGVTGHSFGGFTALAAPAGYTNAVGSVPPDPRISAVVAMAPYSEIIDDAGLAAVDVPTLLITGTLDSTTPIDPMTERPWDHVSGRPLYRVDITGAGHQSFTDVCTYQRLLPTLDDVPSVLIETVDELALQACPDEFLDIDRSHEVIDRFVIEFLETHLAGRTPEPSVLSEDGATTVSEVEFSERRS